MKSLQVDDLVEVHCTCGAANCFSPPTSPKRGTVYDTPFRGRVFVDFWETCGPNPDNPDDSLVYCVNVKDVKPID